MASLHIIRRSNLPANWESEDAPYSDTTFLSLCESEAALLPLTEEEYGEMTKETDWEDNDPPTIFRQIAHSMGYQIGDFIFLLTEDETFPKSIEDTVASVPALANFCVPVSILEYRIREADRLSTNLRDYLSSLR
jgi:hypothetical protein